MSPFFLTEPHALTAQAPFPSRIRNRTRISVRVAECLPASWPGTLVPNHLGRSLRAPGDDWAGDPSGRPQAGSDPIGRAEHSHFVLGACCAPNPRRGNLYDQET